MNVYTNLRLPAHTVFMLFDPLSLQPSLIPSDARPIRLLTTQNRQTRNGVGAALARRTAAVPKLATGASLLDISTTKPVKARRETRLRRLG
jgi:hypothetical protein